MKLKLLLVFIFLIVLVSEACKKHNSPVQDAGKPSVTVSELNFSTVIFSGVPSALTAFTGTATITYTGGGGGTYLKDSVAITSTGVIGLKASLQAGTLTNNTGTIVYTITGTPFSSGTAVFAITFGGKTGSISLIVNQQTVISTPAYTIVPDSAHTFGNRDFLLKPGFGYNYSNAFSWTEDVTTATSVDITYAATIYGLSIAEILVYVNGTLVQHITQPANGIFTNTVALPGTGMKTVKIVVGTQQRVYDYGDIFGTFINSKTYNQLATPKQVTDKNNVVLFNGDSVTMGIYTTAPITDGLVPWVAAQPTFADYTIVATGYGFKGIYPEWDNAADIQTQAVADVKRIGDPSGRKEIWIALGGNDFRNYFASAAQVQISLSAYLDAVHKLNPDINFRLITPFLRYNEPLINSFNEILQDYRVAIAATAVGRESYVVVINGEQFNFLSQSTDGLHPNTIAVATILGPAILPMLQKPFSGEN